MLGKGLAGEVLIIGNLDPAGHDDLVREPIDVLQIHQPRDQTRQVRRAPLVQRKETGLFPLEDIPVDQRRELRQFMAGVNHVDQPRAQQVILFRGEEMELHQ